jgi:CubicO group peptidase (beta-lactamase class C family)
MDIESHTPMRRDAIFRMASMSKPVTGVAILMLVEEGRIRLNDPVSRFIPEFKDTKVAMVKAAPQARAAAPGQPPAASEIYVVPASREITVLDLLTHTSGLESGGAGTREAGRMVPRDTGLSLAEYIPRLGAVPLDFQPGTQWRYSALAGIETLGRIVEVASGQTFDQFLKQRIFDPLGMRDTFFVVPADRTARVVTLYGRTPKGALERQDTPQWLATRTLFSGGGGLYSTADDYIQFAQMLLNGGQGNGTRLLGSRTVEMMGSNHVGTLYSGAGAQVQGMGFGLTVEVVLDPIAAGQRRSAGSFGWDGAFGTHFWVDRKEQLAGLLMIQTPARGIARDFENAVMQAIID